MTHRKVISYYAFADEIDEDGGHGTHVVGSIVANDPMSSGGNSRGAAPGAKVAFIDIGSSTGAATHTRVQNCHACPTVFLFFECTAVYTYH